MQRQPDCERYLANRLCERWQARLVDRDALAKHLILSPKQLDALGQADPSPFHTYGIYLRAMRQALVDAQLLDDSEVQACLQKLVDDYIETPSTSHVLQVKQIVNKKLGVAPPKAEPESAPKPVRAVKIVFAVFAVLALLSVAVLLGLSPQQ